VRFNSFALRLTVVKLPKNSLAPAAWAGIRSSHDADPEPINPAKRAENTRWITSFQIGQFGTHFNLANWPAIL
jgi:hypothetical protein